ncbi:MarR family winged helix-turn-helix transcriptional regulator [Modicisalibacter luteus]|uniref:MarR family winged helix-turn-helix transcriptional regulator n=1 Tax=Modicisalibacter luteus TaxID=453962 RepID=A0ABV7M360_9GAMM|nr:MarR family transcriptional regulator [Halomonas lutea]GHA85978.1 MarR family transcriptional regulator [Halomonas lutea]
MSSLANVWQRLTSVVDRVEGQVGKALQREHGISLSQYRALQFLANAAESELRMQELASLLGLNQSSVTRLVERLEREGCTARDACPKDKRGVYTVLTETGRQRYLEAKRDYEAILEMALDDVASTPGNQTLIACLRRLGQEQA